MIAGIAVQVLHMGCRSKRHAPEPVVYPLRGCHQQMAGSMSMVVTLPFSNHIGQAQRPLVGLPKEALPMRHHGKLAN
jgi:hypothetical protein